MQYVRWMLALAALCWLPGVALAHPSHKTPEDTFEVRPDPVNQELLKHTVKLYGEIEPTVTKAMAATKNQQWNRLKVKDLNDAAKRMLELERNVWWLKMRGEPAGSDYFLRLADLREQLNGVVVEFRKVKESGPQLESLHGALTKDAKKKVQGAPKIEQMLKQKNFEGAEKALYDATDPIMAATIWFDSNPAAKEMAVFQPLLQTMQSAMNQIRLEAADAALVKAREQLTPNFDELMKLVIDATDAVKTGGQAEYGGAQCRGPELVTKFSETWQSAHLATIQCVGLEWARGKAAGAVGSDDLDQLVDHYRQFSLQMTMQLAKLVENDGSRVSADKARQLYFDYLQSLAPLVVLSSEPKFTEVLDPPLKSLAAKDPALATQAESYGRVMGDLLRWRGRTARALVHTHESEYPALDDQCRSTLRSDEEHPGLVHDDGEEVIMTLKSSVPKAMPQVLTLVGKQVSIGNWVGLTASQPLAISQLRRRAYARITRPGRLADEAVALERDLQVTEATPPLTLETAIAVATAKRGDLMSVGGKVTGVYMESMINRFALLKEAGRNLLPLGPLDVSKVGPVPLPHVLLRFDVEPAWVCHSYFFVPLE